MNPKQAVSDSTSVRLNEVDEIEQATKSFGPFIISYKRNHVDRRAEKTEEVVTLISRAKVWGGSKKVINKQYPRGSTKFEGLIALVSQNGGWDEAKLSEREEENLI